MMGWLEGGGGGEGEGGSGKWSIRDSWEIMETPVLKQTATNL